MKVHKRTAACLRASTTVVAKFMVPRGPGVSGIQGYLEGGSVMLAL